MVYYPGRHLVICDRCGFRRYDDEVDMEWTGLLVCKDTCWEPRHPQLDIKSKSDKQYVKNARPEPTDTYVSTASPVTADDL